MLTPLPRPRGIVPLATVHVPSMSNGTVITLTAASAADHRTVPTNRDSYYTAATWVRFRQRPTPLHRDKRDANGTLELLEREGCYNLIHIF
jgi:hypothetical protein